MTGIEPGSRHTRLWPYVALGFGILALSMSSLFIRWSQAAGPVTSFYRMAIAALVLVPVVVFHFRRAGVPRLSLLVWPALAGVFTTLDHGTWSTAIDFTRVANATLLNNISSVWVGLFAVLVWRERLRRWFWLGLLLTLAGAAVVLGGDLAAAPEFTTGNLLALLSSVFYAGYFLVTQRGRRQMDALSYVWLVDVFAALGLLAYSGVFRHSLTGFPAATWWIFLASALISQVGGYFAIVYALGHLPASVVSPTMVAQPVITALLAVPLANEALSPLQVLGGLAVIVGIGWINRDRHGDSAPATV